MIEQHISFNFNLERHFLAQLRGQGVLLYAPRLSAAVRAPAFTAARPEPWDYAVSVEAVATLQGHQRVLAAGFDANATRGSGGHFFDCRNHCAFNF